MLLIREIARVMDKMEEDLLNDCTNGAYLKVLKMGMIEGFIDTALITGAVIITSGAINKITGNKRR